MRRYFVASTLFAVATLAAAVVPAAAHAQIAVLSSTVEERVAAPGDRYSGTIVISNAGDAPQTVRIYKTDYRFQADGTSNFDPAGTDPRSNAAWITPQLSQVVVPANSKVSVPYAVEVPAGDSLVGSYWSTLMVEGQSAPPAAGDSQPEMKIGAIMRYAVQVATHIDNTGTRSVAFTDAGISKTETGDAALDVNVHDNGQRAYRPTLWVEIYDAQGALKAKAKQSRGLLYPGTSLHQHFDLGALPPGTYKAVVFADVGAPAVIATQYTVSF
jgi:hypothetical protein